MRSFLPAWTTSLLCAFLLSLPVAAQGFDPQLAGEVNAIRAQLARSNQALRQYTWTEHTEVLVKGKVQSTSDEVTRYSATGQVVKAPAPADDGSGTSKRPRVRGKAEQQDDIERAVRMIAYYVPPDPVQLDAMLARGDASLEQSEPGKFQIRFKGYYQDGDSMIFTYDPASKALLRVTVLSTLGKPKDTVTMEALFETLPDGVNHLASTTVTAKSKKIEVKTRNLKYLKAN